VGCTGGKCFGDNCTNGNTNNHDDL
jgi:hypothetical protein